ncbi:acyl-CoA N-acyltransferase [Cyathus striatus]|nr:acyl-CoA N-acyltransferase [Cyathus striatus]
MSFVNHYQPPEPHTPRDPNDIYCTIQIPTSLETDRIQLIPFISHLHAKAFYTPFSAEPSMSRWLPVSWPTLDSFLVYTEEIVRSDPTSVLFAVLDKTKLNYEHDIAQSLAGIIGYMRISTHHRTLELGPVIILPRFQRTFVSSNAIGAMLKYALDVPSQGGMGFRRIVWTSSPFNVAGIRAAERMGFVNEGISRWARVVPSQKEANEVNENERGKGGGWDSSVLSICWDDWEGEIKEKVEGLLAKA